MRTLALVIDWPILAPVIVVALLFHTGCAMLPRPHGNVTFTPPPPNSIEVVVDATAIQDGYFLREVLASIRDMDECLNANIHAVDSSMGTRRFRMELHSPKTLTLYDGGRLVRTGQTWIGTNVVKDTCAVIADSLDTGTSASP